MTRNRFWFFGLAVLMLAGTVLAGCGGDRRPKTARDPYRFIRDHNLERLPRFDIPIEINDRVVAWMEYFQGPGRNHFRRYMERSGRYVPLMQEILKKNRMPADLVYIAMIESGFNTQARSWANAVGPWQFISGTGKRYGLRIDSHVDERRDPYKSTQAAVDYFRDLYGEFGDWYLSMAGYNAGEGRVRRAIASTGSRNFWEIASDRDALRPETRDYVPKYIAAAIMAKTPERFGFEKVDYREPFDYDVAQVETQTDLSVIGKCAGVSEDDIFDLNPHLIRGSTPPGMRNYEIRVPRGTQRVFKERYAALPEDDRIQIARYEVRKGDTLSRVARRYGVSASALASVNGLNPKHQRIRVGSTLVIPTGSAARYAEASGAGQAKGDKGAAGKKSAVHTVRKGETLSSISRRYGVSTSQLMAWNKIKSAKKVHAGMRLTIRGAPAAADVKVASKGGGQSADAEGGASGPAQTHKVSKGETLSTIASRYGVTVGQLMAMNEMTSPGQLKYGRQIVIRRAKIAPKAEAQAAPAEVADASASSEQALVADSGQASSAPAKPARERESVAAPAKVHKVGKGDTLGAIAAKHGVTTKELMAMNDIANPKSIRPGQKLVVKKGTPRQAKVEAKPADKPQALPPPPDVSTQVADAAAGPVRPEAVPTQSVEPTAASLSDQVVPLAPQTTAIDLRERDAQSLRKTTNVASAQPLKSQAPKAAPAPAPKAQPEAKQLAYKVKGGDTLWDIARRHKVTIADIQKWNNLSDPSSVRPGTTLKIHNK